MQFLEHVLIQCVCATGSKSDGQKSPSDSVFLRMDEIPYIREDRSETDSHHG